MDSFSTMVVSCGFHSHGGSLKWMVYNGKSNFNRWFRGISGNFHMGTTIASQPFGTPPQCLKLWQVKNLPFAVRQSTVASRKVISMIFQTNDSSCGVQTHVIFSIDSVYIRRRIIFVWPTIFHGALSQPFLHGFRTTKIPTDFPFQATSWDHFWSGQKAAPMDLWDATSLGVAFLW